MRSYTESDSEEKSVREMGSLVRGEASERSFLIPPENLSRLDRVMVPVKYGAGFLRGVTNYASTWPKIAIDIKRPGLWIWGPLTLGGFFNFLSTLSEDLAKKYPQNIAIKRAAKGGAILHAAEVVTAGYGFTWTMIQLGSDYMFGLKKSHSDEAQLIIPLVAVVSLFSSYLKLRQEKGQTTSPYLRIPLNFLSSMNTSGPLMGLLIGQDVLSEDSIIPVATFITMGMIGALSSSLENKAPMTSVIGFAIVELVMIVGLVVNLLNDLMSSDAAAHNHKVSDNYFHGALTGASLSSVILLVLLFYQTMNTLNKVAEKNQEKAGDRITEIKDSDVEAGGKGATDSDSEFDSSKDTDGYSDISSGDDDENMNQAPVAKYEPQVSSCFAGIFCPKKKQVAPKYQPTTLGINNNEV